MKNDILYFEEKYYILAKFLRKLFKQNHDDFHAKNFEYEKILELFRRKYWWSNMSRNVKKCVVSCTKCLLTNSIKHKFYELLQLLWNFYSLWHRHKTIHTKVFTYLIRKKNLNEKKKFSFLILSRRKSSSTNQR
jgi:hypothetical protein